MEKNNIKRINNMTRNCSYVYTTSLDKVGTEVAIETAKQTANVSNVAVIKVEKHAEVQCEFGNYLEISEWAKSDDAYIEEMHNAETFEEKKYWAEKLEASADKYEAAKCKKENKYMAMHAGHVVSELSDIEIIGAILGVAKKPIKFAGKGAKIVKGSKAVKVAAEGLKAAGMGAARTVA